ncbi:GTPase HflX, partial (plasmid) [Chromobacterium amazonense]|nr:GTPase HflX [Chromobacterium amazonense]
RDAQIEEVNKVLAEIDADGIPQLIVWNKCDLKALPPEIERGEDGQIVSVRVSALKGEGLELLREAIAERVQPFANNHKEPYEHVAE